MVNKLLKIAKESPFGFTYNTQTNKLLKLGITVAYLETQNSFNDEGLQKVIQHSQENDKIIGGWLNVENGKYYFDSIKLFFL
jgi:hypothetical protein